MAYSEANEIGTIHIILNSCRTASYLASGVLANDAEALIDVSGVVPVGARGIYIGAMTSAGAGEASHLSIGNGEEGLVENAYNKYLTIWNEEENYEGYQSGLLISALSVNRKFRIQMYTSKATAGYWLMYGGYYI